MTLVDTSVWIGHFRDGDKLLQDKLMNGEVLTHPLIIGELACGNLVRRDEVLEYFGSLPLVAVATHEEVMHMINSRKLHGKGLGFIDMHLIASSLIDHAELWTKDRRLASVMGSLTRKG